MECVPGGCEFVRVCACDVVVSVSLGLRVFFVLCADDYKWLVVCVFTFPISRTHDQSTMRWRRGAVNVEQQNQIYPVLRAWEWGGKPFLGREPAVYSMPERRGGGTKRGRKGFYRRNCIGFLKNNGLYVI